MMKVTDIRKLSNLEILKKVYEIRVELAQKKMERYIGKETNVSGIKSLKKDIARLLTILKEKEALNE